MQDSKSKNVIGMRGKLIPLLLAVSLASSPAHAVSKKVLAEDGKTVGYAISCWLTIGFWKSGCRKGQQKSIYQVIQEGAIR